MTIPDLLERLLVAVGPSGYEGAASQVWREAAAEYGEVTTDTLGSSFVRFRGGDGPVLAVLGHIDEIGMIVTHVDDSGFLSVREVGGWNPLVFLGQRVTVQTREGPLGGVIGAKRVRTHGRGEKPEPPELADLHVDVGARDAEEARRLVRPGDVAVVDATPLAFPNGRVVSRALDNRIGCFIVLEILRLLAAGDPAPGDVVAGVTTLEENGGAGAMAAVFDLRPDVALVFDVTAATDVPGADPRDDGAHELGSGPAILRGASASSSVSELLLETAEAEGIPFTIEVAGRRSQSDADEIHRSRAGIATGLVSIPIRYMHSPVEMVQLEDADACARLAVAFARRLQPGLTLGG